jgi:hypothetical protein
VRALRGGSQSPLEPGTQRAIFGGFNQLARELADAVCALLGVVALAGGDHLREALQGALGGAAGLGVLDNQDLCVGADDGEPFRLQREGSDKRMVEGRR